MKEHAYCHEPGQNDTCFSPDKKHRSLTGDAGFSVPRLTFTRIKAFVYIPPILLVFLAKNMTESAIAICRVPG